MSSTSDAQGGYRDALAVGEFRALFVAYIVSMLGDIVAAVALTVLVFERTASPFLAGLTFTLAFVPYLFSGALLSGLVDRVPPRRLMIVCDLLSAAIVALMTISAVPVPLLLALLFCLGLISPIAAGVRNALTVVVLPADAYIAGRSLFRIVAQSAQVVGNATGGLLIALTSPRGALALDCVSFLGSVVVVRLGTQARPSLAGAETASRAAISCGTRCRGCRRCSRIAASGACCCSAGSFRPARWRPRLWRRPMSPNSVSRRLRWGGGSLPYRPARSRGSSWPSGSCRRPGAGGWSACWPPPRSSRCSCSPGSRALRSRCSCW